MLDIRPMITINMDSFIQLNEEYQDIRRNECRWERWSHWLADQYGVVYTGVVHDIDLKLEKRARQFQVLDPARACVFALRYAGGPAQNS
jgi:hypothetical protein